MLNFYIFRFTFFPYTIALQFKSYFNIFFLFTAILLSIPILSPLGLETTLAPFLVVLMIGILRELFEDAKRHLYDKTYNNSISLKYNNEKRKFKNDKWKNFNVGCLLKILKNETIPADLLVIKSSSNNGYCYLQTTNLDGESTLKPREALYCFSNKIMSEKDLATEAISGYIEIDHPNNNIYQAEGRVVFNETKERSQFDMNNIVLRGGCLKNVDYIIGIVLYSGNDTKLMKNIQIGSLKMSNIEIKLNKIVIYVMIITFLVCIICTFSGYMFRQKNSPNKDKLNISLEYIYLNSVNSSDYLEFFKIFTSFFAIFSTLIPISIMIMLEVAKGIQVGLLSLDKLMKNDKNDKFKVLSLKLQEDLGNIHYIFTDKTGTLTKNEMEFRACSIFNILYDESIETDNNNYNSKLYEEDNEPGRSCFSKEFNNEVLKAAISNQRESDIFKFHNSRYKYIAESVTEFFLSIAINHNVLLEYDNKGRSYYQGSSPDECVLVKSAQELGIEFIERSGNKINLIYFNQKVNFDIYHRFEYSSSRMRSSIIIKDISGNIKLYIKGADTVILKRIDEFSKNYLLKKTKEDMDTFAKKGLRTLCYAVKTLNIDEFKEWESKYLDIKFKSIEDKSLINELEECISEIENNVTLLGTTALEDKLQEDVANCLSSFIESGIEVFMLTGDKLDTAETIGYGCKLFKDDTEVFKIKNELDVTEINSRLKYVLKEMKEIENNMLNKNKDISKNKIRAKNNYKTFDNNLVVKNYSNKNNFDLNNKSIKLKQKNLLEDNSIEFNYLYKTNNNLNKATSFNKNKKKDLNSKLCYHSGNNSIKEDVNLILDNKKTNIIGNGESLNIPSIKKYLDQLNLDNEYSENVLFSKYKKTHSFLFSNNLNLNKNKNIANLNKYDNANIIQNIINKYNNKKLSSNNFDKNVIYENIHKINKNINSTERNKISSSYNLKRLTLDNLYISNKIFGKFNQSTNSNNELHYDKDEDIDMADESIFRGLCEEGFYENMEMGDNISVIDFLKHKKTVKVNDQCKYVNTVNSKFNSKNNIIKVNSIKSSNKEIKNLSIIIPQKSNNIDYDNNNNNINYRNNKKHNDYDKNNYYENNDKEYKYLSKNQFKNNKYKLNIKDNDLDNQNSKNNNEKDVNKYIENLKSKIEKMNIQKNENMLNFNWIDNINLNLYNKKINKINDINNDDYLNNDTHDFDNNELSNFTLANFGILVEGSAITKCLDKSNNELFWKIILKSRSIICCRCSPIQKSDIVQFVKKKSSKITLSIGDGGNDVNMIKEANIGIGIFGKEGSQAAYSADYAISQFKYLKRLLLYHGRYYLMRNSYFVMYYFYKNLIFTFPQFLFAFYNGFSGTLLWDNYYYLAYNSFITMAPVGLRMLYEEDIDINFKGYPNRDKQLELIPNIYKEYRNSKPFTVAKFFLVFLCGLIHSLIIYYIPFLCYNENYIYNLDGMQVDVWSGSFCSYISLILIQLIIIFQDIYYYNSKVVLLNILQIFVIISFLLFHQFVITEELGGRLIDELQSIIFYLVVLVTVCIGCIPYIIIRRIIDFYSQSIINSLRMKKSEYDLLKKEYEKKLEATSYIFRTMKKFKKLHKIILNNNFEPDNLSDKKMKEMILKILEKRLESNNINKYNSLYNNKIKVNNNPELLYSGNPVKKNTESLIKTIINKEKKLLKGNRPITASNMRSINERVSENFKNIEVNAFDDAVSDFKSKLESINNKNLTKVVRSIVSSPAKNYLNKNIIVKKTSKNSFNNINKINNFGNRRFTDFNDYDLKTFNNKINLNILNYNKKADNLQCEENENINFDKSWDSNSYESIEIKNINSYKQNNLVKSKSQIIAQCENINDDKKINYLDNTNKLNIEEKGLNNKLNINNNISNNTNNCNKDNYYILNNFIKEKSQTYDNDNKNELIGNTLHSANNDNSYLKQNSPVSSKSQDKDLNKLNNKYKNNETIIEESIYGDLRHDSTRKLDIGNLNINEIVNEINEDGLQDFNNLDLGEDVNNMNIILKNNE